MTNKTTTTRTKIQIRKDTLRKLSPGELGGVAGGSLLYCTWPTTKTRTTQ